MPNLLYTKEIEITPWMKMRIPAVGEILDNEEAFDNIVYSIVSTPYELMVPLDDAGIDFSKISRFDVFGLLFPKLQTQDTTLLFADTDFSGLNYGINRKTGERAWVDETCSRVIDRMVHAKMCSVIESILQVSIVDKKAGNEEARKYLVDKARRKMKRRKKEKSSQLEAYIIAMVNSKDFKYDYTTVRDLSIYQFYASLKQISHKIQFDNTMIGYYTGSIKFDDISQKDKNWILTTTT